MINYILSGIWFVGAVVWCANLILYTNSVSEGILKLVCVMLYLGAAILFWFKERKSDDN